jgi:hypothetical protein
LHATQYQRGNKPGIHTQYNNYIYIFIIPYIELKENAMLKYSRTFSAMTNVLILFSLLLTSTVFPSPAGADSVITVATNISNYNAVDGLCSLSEAISNANDDAQTYTDCVPGSGNDTIQFNDLLGTATITLIASLPNITDVDGLTINGGGDITINGNNTYQIFTVQATVPFALSNLALINGTPAVSNNEGSLTVTNSTFSGNSNLYGGAIVNLGTLIATNSLFSGNTSTGGGGSAIYNSSTMTITHSTFANNTGTGNARGSIYNSGTTTISNSTFYGNVTTGTGCCNGAGAVYNQGTMSITNTTFSGNGTNTIGGGADIYQLVGTSSLNLYNNILANSTGEVNCRLDAGSGTVTGTNNLIESQVGCATTAPITDDPQLGTATGSPAYFPLLSGSPAIDAGDDTKCAAAPVNNSSQNGVARPQGQQCDIGSFEYTPVITVTIGGVEVGENSLLSGASTRQSYSGINDGPVKIESDSASMIAAERVIYAVNGVNTSFSEMMGFADEQLGTTYWLPWYNNVDLDTQLRFGNVSGAAASVHVYIGGVEMTGSPFALTASGAGQSTRVSFNGVNAGPVQIVSDQQIVASERVIYTVGGVATSFSEMMAVPNSQLNTTYWLPWYNNVDLDTQLRIGNVSGVPASVQVYIGGTEVSGSPFALTASGAGQSIRLSFAGVNAGPVQIVSNQNIVAAERVIYTVNGTATSFSEMMALPNGQLSTTYWLPWYNNVDLDTQLRIGNVSGVPASVHVYIGGVEMTGSPFALTASGTNQSTRLSFAGTNNGPVKIVSDQNIVAAERVIYTVGGVATSFSEMMALPNHQLDVRFWMPWYNNVDLDTQLRFGLP